MRKYLSFFLLSFKTDLRHYKEMAGLSLFMVSCITIFASIWEGAVGKAGSASFSPRDLVWYIALNEWVLVALPQAYLKITDDFKSGQFTYHLLRPCSLILTKLAEGLGELAASLCILGPIAFLTAYAWTACCPLSLPEVLMCVFFAFIGGSVAVMAFLLIGFFRFWLEDVVPIHWVFEKLLFLFGGLFLPLETYPLWLKKVAFFMPSFPILGGRSALIFERTASYLLFLTASSVLWFALFFLLSSALLKKGLNETVQEGG